MKNGKRIQSALISMAAVGFAVLPARAGASQSPGTLAACVNLADDHSVYVGSQDLISQCHDLVLAASSGTANRLSADGTLHAFAYGPLLFIDRTDTSHPNPDGTYPTLNQVVAGKNTFFRNAASVAIDSVNSEIYVLDSSAQNISVYSIFANGNLRPIRFITSAALETASALTVDPVNNELLVLSSGHDLISVYGRLADVDGSQPRNSTAIIRTVDLSGIVSSGSQLADIAVSAQHSDIYALDEGLGQIVAVNRSAGAAAPQSTFGQGELTEAQFILYSSTNDTVLVMTSKGSWLSLPLSSQ